MIRIAGLALVVAIAATGCGGSDEPAYDAAGVEAAMTTALPDTMPAGATIRQIDCVEDGDAEHWRCRALVDLEGQRYSLSTPVTCGGDQCLSEPAALIPIR